MKQEITSLAAKSSFNSRKQFSYINSMKDKGIFKNYLKCRVKEGKKAEQSRKFSEIHRPFTQ